MSPAPLQTGKYDEIFSKFETGDILLFHGTNYWFSYIVEWATWSEFSHVGIVLKDPTYIDPKLKGYYMLESGTESFPDAVYHRINFGVQIVDLEKLYDLYSGKIYHRSLEAPKETCDTFCQILPDVWDRIKNLPYDDKLWDLFRTEFGVDWGNMERKDSFFCSALTTFIYERLDLLATQLQWDLITPQDFDDGGKIDKTLLPNIKLIDKTRIK